MLKKIQQAIYKLFSSKKLKQKLFFTLAVFFIFRLLAHIPLPAVDVASLKKIFSNNQFLSLLNIFSGGTLSRFSVVAVGISPYISASIVMQLAGMVFPKLKEMQKEGESGRAQINQYTRLLAVPLAILQSVSVIALLNSQKLLITRDPFALLTMVASLVAGAMVLMWLGELVGEYGIGNGISMVMFAGIASQIPTALAQTFSVTSQEQVMTLLTFALVFVLVIALVVFMNEAVRKVTIQYAKRTRGSRSYGGQTTHLPVRVNVAGVMPSIFALSIMMVPSFVGRLLAGNDKENLMLLGQKIIVLFDQSSFLYMAIYFVIVFTFTFFSALVFFNAEDLSEELKKSGAFIPGIRPGGPSKKFLEYVVGRITFVGALFLGLVALLPSLAQNFTGVQSLAIGGTSVLIVVSVILETAKQVESMTVGQNYEKYR